MQCVIIHMRRAEVTTSGVSIHMRRAGVMTSGVIKHMRRAGVTTSGVVSQKKKLLLQQKKLRPGFRRFDSRYR